GAAAELGFHDVAHGMIAGAIDDIGGGTELAIGKDAYRQGGCLNLVQGSGGLCAKFHGGFPCAWCSAVDYPAYSHMSLFKRSVVAEITSHAGVVFSTLVVVWLSVLLVRLLGEAAGGSIGADVVLGLAAFSTITALPT